MILICPAIADRRMQIDPDRLPMIGRSYDSPENIQGRWLRAEGATCKNNGRRSASVDGIGQRFRPSAGMLLHQTKFIIQLNYRHRGKMICANRRVDEVSLALTK
jgi:hypothetical protein